MPHETMVAFAHHQMLVLLAGVGALPSPVGRGLIRAWLELRVRGLVHLGPNGAPHPEPSLRSDSDLSPHAGRGAEQRSQRYASPVARGARVINARGEVTMGQIR